ncbi:hypothetical protein GQ53DRAFT_764257 [Thozetella sp. PMI_491]|nr:hypothetical protein GQ53DRAFT_764257 [Thozetella sp. PMI_491]
MQNTYVVAPNFSIVPGPKVEASKAIPSDGRLQLGDILTEPFGPLPIGLNRNRRIPIDKNYLDNDKNEKKTVDLTATDLWSGRLGVWASILASFGIGAAVDLSIQAMSRSKDILKIKSLETHEFDLRDDYVKKVLATKPVKDYIEEFDKNRGKKNTLKLYMISGLKIAKGASSEFTDLFQASATIGASDQSGSNQAKLLEAKRRRYRGVTFKASTDFVLAYQLMRVKYNLDTKEGKVEGVSLENVTMADGTEIPAEIELGYEGFDNDLSTAEAPEKVMETSDATLGENVVVYDID